MCAFHSETALLYRTEQVRDDEIHQGKSIQQIILVFYLVYTVGKMGRKG